MEKHLVYKEKPPLGGLTQGFTRFWTNLFHHNDSRRFCNTPVLLQPPKTAVKKNPLPKTAKHPKAIDFFIRQEKEPW